MNDIVNAVSNLGFPVFCVIALGALVYKGFEKITSSNKEREKLLYEMLAETTKQLNAAIEINASFVEILNELKSNVAVVQDDIIKIKTTLKMRKDG